MFTEILTTATQPQTYWCTTEVKNDTVERCKETYSIYFLQILRRQIFNSSFYSSYNIAYVQRVVDGVA